ncbi:hypothetical protein [Tunicatimonas pelagia]|uniref:hypothetical protein n=1 Tax=Tunicatimonas pelagia TaxID=931531 RepID=UPI002666F5A7|nr:hypothetical protein [Tunicatimonas pelagia]WKN43643.1 hypothetical protein P0M28_01500 [Tunicatimonas pelagia]
MYMTLIFALLLFFQEAGNATDEGVPYTPQEGFGGPLLWIAAAAVLVIVAFVVIRVFRRMQRSRNLERMAEDANSDNKTL